MVSGLGIAPELYWCRMFSVKSLSVPFRCHPLLLEKVDEVAALSGCSRSMVLVEMVRLFLEELEKRDGRLLPPYVGGSLQEHFDDLRRSLNPREASSAGGRRSRCSVGGSSDGGVSDGGGSDGGSLDGGRLNGGSSDGGGEG